MKMALVEMQLLDMRVPMKKTGNTFGWESVTAIQVLEGRTTTMQTLTAPTGIQTRKLIKHGWTTVSTLLEHSRDIPKLLDSHSMGIPFMDSLDGMKRGIFQK